ncbi:Endoglucanase [Quillaja saponaria]|uniref:Endoglucanase n=1 Tax=Quillaja saponaria TaxID=32244 RepID=A0AAD7LWL5_QUISA|nr:Endoglucanase [Quillaja saponaria]
MSSSYGSPTHTSASDVEMQTVRFVHRISEAGRLLPSSSRWNSIDLDFHLVPKSSISYDSIPSSYSKSFDYNLVITDRKYFNRFVYISASVLFVILAVVLLVHFLPHKHKHHDPSMDLKVALNQALTFFDAQKSGFYPKNSPVKFRGDSGLQDGNSTDKAAKLLGGFYDSGNNIKFSFPMAYTMTLLSWTVIEYHSKYADIGELDHVKDIIKWGSDYLLKVFVPANATSGSPTTLYSQVGSISNDTKTPNDLNCWQRPEDMKYPRPVSICDSTASDLAGEIVAALSAASLVFKEDKVYSMELTKAAESLYKLVKREDSKQGTYTAVDACGEEARKFYNSSGYKDELVWGGTWLFFATGNTSYLGDATDIFDSAESDETEFDKGIFYWNNKLTASAVLLTRIRYFHDLGFPYEDALSLSSNLTDSLMCSYLSNQYFKRTPGGLILLRPDYGEPLQFAATASFLSKLYSDYLDLLRQSGGSCSSDGFSVEMLRSFSISQVNYILGDNPMKMSYMVGFGDQFPTQVHHRGASIPWNGQHYTCEEGDKWLNSKDPNPQVLLGAMVAGPDQYDNFVDERNKPWFTEPSMASNAGLVAALVALHDPPQHSSDLKDNYLGIDLKGIFDKVHLVPSAS